MNITKKKLTLKVPQPIAKKKLFLKTLPVLVPLPTSEESVVKNPTKATTLMSQLDKKDSSVRECGICYQTYNDWTTLRIEINVCAHPVCPECSRKIVQCIQVYEHVYMRIYKCPFCRQCTYDQWDCYRCLVRWGFISEEKYNQFSEEIGLENFMKKIEKQPICTDCGINFDPDFEGQPQCWMCLI